MDNNLSETCSETYRIMQEADAIGAKTARWWRNHCQERQKLSIDERFDIDGFIANTSLSETELAELSPADILEAVRDD